MTIPRFRALVLAHAKKHGRDGLPWRAKRVSPYQVLVSEIMLQQTQVDRVIPYFRAFLKRFPSVRALAQASLADVLTAWQGLGYNRRAKLLHTAAQMIVEEHAGRVPHDVAVLEKLPGIGPYTARAIVAFAYNEDTIFIETNLRTAVIHHFFPERESITDAEILAVLKRALPKGNARMWYAALMDYGSHLKRSGVRVNARSASYAQQKSFSGSNREARGAILRALAKGPKREASIARLLGPQRSLQLMRALAALRAEGMVAYRKGMFRLPDASYR